MKKIVLKKVSTLFILCSFAISASYGNTVQNISKQNKNIEAYIKVWGLVKYRSPLSIAGKFDVDKVFLANIEGVKDANFEELNLLLLDMTNNAGVSVNSRNASKSCTNCLTKNMDDKWIGNKLFSKETRLKLKGLYHNINLSESHHYINKVHYETEILNEPQYKDYVAFKDETMNLLALAKSWSAIEYLYPYKYQMDKNNHQILSEMIPVFRDVKSRASYEKAVLTFETNINDTHAAGFLDQLKSKAEIFKINLYPPFDYKCLEKGIVVEEFLNDSLECASTLKKGDVIVAINNVKIKNWFSKKMELLPASNMAVKYRLLSMDWKGNVFAFYDVNDDTLDVKVLRGNKRLSLKLNMLKLTNKNSLTIINKYIKKRVKEDEQVKPYENLGDDVAIIRGGYFSSEHLPKNEKEETKFSEELKSKKALIFDMRKYPNGGLFYYFIPMALGKKSFEFAKYYRANLEDPGSFSLVPGLELYLSNDLKTDDNPYKGKIVILTNENTQSKGEWYTMMLRQLSKNTTVIGSQTAGTDGDLKLLNIPGGYQFIFTGNGIFYPDGRETQRIGIVPDIYFNPSIATIANDSDAHLQRALEFLNHGK